MLAQLATLKSRLELTVTTYDTLLTAAIAAVSARFDVECNRTLARTVDATFEFPADETNLCLPCYPIEAITKFETKETEADTWTEQTAIDYLLLANSVLSLKSPLCTLHSSLCIGKVTYTGGYVLPGDPDPQPSNPDHPPVRLPADLENACIEQVAFWFQTRSSVGAIKYWPANGNYLQFGNLDLLPSVRSVLRKHTRYVI